MLAKPTPLGLLGYMPQVAVEKIDWPKLAAVCLQNGVFAVQIDPGGQTGQELVPPSIKFTPSESIYYRHTTTIDLGLSEDEILNNMHPKWRYNTKLAQKHQIAVEISDSDAVFAEFLDLFFETVKRQNYFGRSPSYYKTIWQVLKPSGKVKIATAKKDGELLTAWMLYLHAGVIYYPYGGSSVTGKELMPGHGLVWGIIQWGKENGYNTLDLWGTLGPNADPKMPTYGFHRFKMGFGGAEVTYANSFTAIFNPAAFWVFRFANQMRWLLLKLKRLVLKA